MTILFCSASLSRYRSGVVTLQLPPAGPPKPKKPEMSSARKKLRDLLCRSKGNPRYFDDE